MITGSIPNRLFISCRKTSQKFNTYFENWDKSILSIDVVPAFVCDADKKETKETALSWAKVYDEKESPATFEVDNTEEFTKNTFIVGFEKRSEGGFAWKVIINYHNTNYLFDFRHDTLFDVMRNSQIKLGKIECPLVWARVASQMKLIRKESEIYNKLIELNEKKQLPNILAKDLVLNGLYENTNGEKFIYVGEVELYQIAFKYLKDDRIESFPIKIKKVKRQLWAVECNGDVSFDIIKSKEVKKYCGQNDDDIYSRVLLESKEYKEKCMEDDLKYIFGCPSPFSHCYLNCGYVDRFLQSFYAKVGEEIELPEETKNIFKIDI